MVMVNGRPKPAISFFEKTLGQLGQWDRREWKMENEEWRMSAQHLLRRWLGQGRYWLTPMFSTFPFCEKTLGQLGQLGQVSWYEFRVPGSVFRVSGFEPFRVIRGRNSCFCREESV